MEDFLNPSPVNLNQPKQSTPPSNGHKTSPFETSVELNFDENIFTKKIEEDPKIEKQPEAKRRINDFDGDILGKYAEEKTSKLTFKGKLREFFKNKNGFRRANLKDWEFNDYKEFACLLFLPGLYKSKTVKASIKRLVALNNIANELVSKKIPYGEAQEHYNNLIENLSLATNIQADLKRRL